MNVKNIHTILLIALILTSCAPAVTVVSPAETAVPIPTVSPLPSTTIAPTRLPENITPTSKPTGSLSADGPWLLYVHNSPLPPMPGSDEVPPEFILLNQDGSGRTSILSPGCYHGGVDKFLMEGPNAVNYIAPYEDGLYLFRPAEATGILFYKTYWYSVCQTFFNGDEKGGLLASIYQATDDAVPELIIYELPAGKIRDRFPLVRCGEKAKVCNQDRSNWSEMGAQEPQWSPNGRYLAFAAVLEADSSDLFVYDSQDGSLRRLTSGPDWVGPIEWSPDGSQIIMQELLNEGDFFFAPSSVPPSSVWSVSVSTNEIKLLYSSGGASARQNILQWLDDRRFVAYEGFLVNADQARNLRLVDMESGTNRILFDGEFGSISFDPMHKTFALYALYTEQYGQGIYLVSIDKSTIHPVETSSCISFPDWDERTGLFVSSDPCENDPQRLQAFDYQGNSRCVPKPTPDPWEAARYPSPDGKWTISAKDGLWLESAGNAAVRLSQKTPSDVIWCPDSNCVFFSLFQQDQQWTLYRVSLPDLTIKTVDEGIKSTGSYQWLGGKK